MAKADKAAKKATKEEVVEKTAATPEFKYGVSDLAEKLDIKPASVRVQLRNKGVEKAGKSYGWNTKAELQEVVDQLKAAAASDDEKPAKGKKAKAAAEEPAPKGKKDKKNKKAKADA